VDVVHLCTPNYLHFPMAKAALEAGKHVLCEKPLATSAAEAAGLAKLARQKGRVGAVNYNLRFFPLCQEAKTRAASGSLGDVRLVHGEYIQDWLFLPSDWNWRLDPALGGTLRAVADIGTHWMDMITWITGLEISEVMADVATFNPIHYKPRGEVETFAGKLKTADEGEPVEIHTEDYAGILMRFNNGARGSLTVSQVSAGHKNRMWYEINGNKSSLSWDQDAANQIWFGYREKPNEVMLKDPALMQAGARPFARFPGGHAEGYPDTFYQSFKAVYDYVAAGDFNAPAGFATFDNGWRELLLCEAILQSARSQRWVKVQYS
jgi:predicted dehydrogenase